MREGGATAPGPKPLMHAQVSAVCIISIAGFKPWYSEGPTGNPFRHAMDLAGTSWKMGDLSQSRREEVSGLLEAAAAGGDVNGEAKHAFKGTFEQWMKSPEARETYMKAVGTGDSNVGQAKKEQDQDKGDKKAAEPQQLATVNADAAIIDAVDSSPEIRKLKEQVAAKRAALAAQKARLAELQAKQKERTELAQNKENSKLEDVKPAPKRMSLKGLSPGVSLGEIHRLMRFTLGHNLHSSMVSCRLCFALWKHSQAIKTVSHMSHRGMPWVDSPPHGRSSRVKAQLPSIAASTSLF